MSVSHKAEGGLIKLDLAVENERIENVKITGDFFIYPEDAVFALEKRLRGKTEKGAITIVRDFLDEVESPGIDLKDFKILFKKAFEEKNAV